MSPIDKYLKDVLLDILDASLTSVLDPNPIRFRKQNEKGIKPIHINMKKQEGKTYNLQPHLARNDFLYGCLDFTEKEPIEHLIVGYGMARGRSSTLEAIHHIIGRTGQVQVPHDLLNIFQRYILSKPRNQIVIFHNHPTNWVNTTFDNLPMASTADRRLMLTTKYLQPFIAIKELLGLGGVQYFIGENGFVREFRMPSILQIINILSIS